MKHFLQDESGQTTVEYVLFLAILIVVILGVGRSIGTRISTLAKESIIPLLTRGFFNRRDRSAMYRYRM